MGIKLPEGHAHESLFSLGRTIASILGAPDIPVTTTFTVVDTGAEQELDVRFDLALGVDHPQYATLREMAETMASAPE